MSPASPSAPIQYLPWPFSLQLRQADAVVGEPALDLRGRSTGTNNGGHLFETGVGMKRQVTNGPRDQTTHPPESIEDDSECHIVYNLIESSERNKILSETHHKAMFYKYGPLHHTALCNNNHWSSEHISMLASAALGSNPRISNIFLVATFRSIESSRKNQSHPDGCVTISRPRFRTITSYC